MKVGRNLALLSALGLSACGTEAPAPPSITEIVPPEAVAGVALEVAIHGVGFAAAITVDYGNPNQSSVDRAAEVSLTPDDGRAPVIVHGTIVDTSTIVVTVPAAVGPGRYAVAIIDGLGRTAKSPVDLVLLKKTPKASLKWIAAPTQAVIGECSRFVVELLNWPADAPRPSLAVATRPEGMSYANGCGQPGASVTFGPQGRAAFGIKAEQAGPVGIEVSVPGVASLAASLSVVEARLELAGPRLVVPGECTRGFSVAILGTGTIPDAVDIELKSSGSGASDVAFHDTEACTDAPVSSVKMLSGTPHAFAIRAPRGTQTLQAIAGPLSAELVVKSGAKLALAGFPQVLALGECSAPLTVGLLDPEGNPLGAPAALPITLGASSTVGFFADTLCTQPIAGIDLSEGQETASFYVQSARTPGPVEVVAKAPKVDEARGQLTFGEENAVEILVPPVMAEGVPSQVEIRSLGRTSSVTALNCVLTSIGNIRFTDGTPERSRFRWVVFEERGSDRRLGCSVNNAPLLGHSLPFEVRRCENVPPKAELKVSTRMPAPGQTVALATRGSTGATSLLYRWDLEGRGELTPASPLPAIDHAFASPGVVRPVLEVRDAAGCPAYASTVVAVVEPNHRVEVDCGEPEAACTRSLRSVINGNEAVAISIQSGVSELRLLAPLNISQPVALLADGAQLIGGTLTFDRNASGSLLAGFVFQPDSTAISIQSGSVVTVAESIFRGTGQSTAPVGTAIESEGDLQVGPDVAFVALATGVLVRGGQAVVVDSGFVGGNNGILHLGGALFTAGNVFMRLRGTALRSEPEAANGALSISHNTLHDNAVGVALRSSAQTFTNNIFSNDRSLESQTRVLIDVPGLGANSGNQVYGDGLCLNASEPLCLSRSNNLPYLDAAAGDLRLHRNVPAVNGAVPSPLRTARLTALRALPSSLAFDVGAYESPYTE